MTRLLRSTSIFGTLLLALPLSLASNARAAEPGPAPVPSAERAILVSITAQVTALDLAKRRLTLTGPLGNVASFVVDERVKRLDEFSVGDNVTADYYVSVAGELRAPTDEEKKEPLVAIGGGAKAPKGSSPAAGVLQAYKVVATVVGIDLPSQSITLQGPLGNTGVIRAESVDNIKALRLGDTIVVTYTEALAISLVKAAPAAK